MKKKFLHFQPEYVRKFICDGKLCNAHCCRKSWIITIDKDIYEKYSKLKSNSAVQDFMQYIKFDKNLDSYILDKQGKDFCPMLGEDNLCNLQKNYGLDFLSVTCQTYPRIIYKLNGMYEWSLTVSCPVVAKLALSPDEPMAFEKIDLFPPLDTNIKARRHKIPQEILPHIFEIQFAAISILQNRTLTIDQRLAILGFFLNQLQDMQKSIPALVDAYTSEDFILQNSTIIFSKINFSAKNFIKIIFGDVFSNVYEYDKRHQKYLNNLMQILEIEIDNEGAVEINKIAENYLKLTDSYADFMKNYSTVFENYLVNEFFANMYPFNITGTIDLNFKVFVIAYKIVELFAFSALYKSGKNFSEIDKTEIISIISELTETVDHSEIYLEKIAQAVEDKNIFTIMKSFLQV